MANTSTKKGYGKVSGPANTSSISALSATFAVIGPVWSIVASIGITPV